MKIIEINALKNGAHRNQDHSLSYIPDGWAMIPEGMAIPETFPFVDITADGGVVTSMVAGTVPDRPKPAAEKPVETETPVTWDELATAYQEGVNSID